MSIFDRDPVTNAVHHGIKRGIRTCLEGECFGSAVILIYSGIDTMAFLGCPSNQIEVTRRDFVDWCNRYVQFAGHEQITGEELYGARCGMLHTYGVESNMSRAHGARKLGYMDHAEPPILYNKTIDGSLVLVSVTALANAFFSGVDRFLVDVFSDTNRATIVEARFQNLVCSFPTRPPVL